MDWKRRVKDEYGISEYRPLCDLEEDTQIYSGSVPAGLLRKPAYRSHVAGIGLNWRELPDDLGVQAIAEAFWYLQFTQNLVTTPQRVISGCFRVKA